MSRVMRHWVIATAVTMTVAVTTSAQAPQPPARPAPQPPPAPRTGTVPAQPAAAASEPATDGRPTEKDLWGIPVYPSAVFLRSYDAGRGQRYYIYGSSVPFAELVTYYRNITKDKGDLVFELPPTHVFEVARFREETMAFPPSVTVKDYTFSGSAGYPNPKPGTQPERYPTLIQIVPPPPGTAK